MNSVLLADIISGILDGKKVDIDGVQYWIESYSEDEKLVVFANADEEDESFEYTAIIRDTVV